VSADQVDEFARRCGVELPDDYRQFLLADNGGLPSPDAFVTPDGGLEVVRILYGIRPDGARGTSSSNSSRAPGTGRCPRASS
jgi:hypothetical protein